MSSDFEEFAESSIDVIKKFPVSLNPPPVQFKKSLTPLNEGIEYKKRFENVPLNFNGSPSTLKERLKLVDDIKQEREAICESVQKPIRE